MKMSKKLIGLIALLLVLAVLLTTCHYSCSSDPVSNSASGSVESEEMSVSDSSEAADASEEASEASDADEASEPSVSGEDSEEDYEDATAWEPVSDEDLPEIPLRDITADVQEEETVSKVVLPSGRDWVKYVLDVEDYRKYHKDLDVAFGDDWDAYVDHWLSTGVYEGRTQGVLFDPFAYADAYPDVKEECGDDVNKIIQHYITYGLQENRPIGTTEGYEDFADKISREQMVGEAIDRTPSTRLEALVAQAENALLYGRNIEGAKYPKLMVDGINPTTMEAPIWNRLLAPQSQYYVSNLYGQTNFLKMLVGLSEMTGDEKYKEAAYDQIQVRYDSSDWVDENGLFYAGGHAVSDVMTGKQAFLYHETKDYQLPLELYYEVDPEGFEKYVTAYWNAHIYDPSSLIMNRHGIYDKEMWNGDFWSSEYTNTDPFVVSEYVPFTCTGNDMVEMAYFLSEKTGDPKYRAWGERMLDKYIGVTDPITGITGPQYGILIDPDTGVRDRWLYNFAGADFVDNRGVDYKTLTEMDSEICGETMKTDRNTAKSTMGYLPQIYIELYEKTGQEKIYDFVKGNMLGFVRYMYDPVRHVQLSPMSINGTDFNPGEGNGPVLVAPRGGYYAAGGKSFAESEAMFELIFKSLIDTAHMIKDEDADERAEIWAAARSWAQYVDLGDIGTALGENVNVNLYTSNHNAMNILAVLSLYKYTGHQQYYDLAVRMADNALKAYFNEETGLFTTYKTAAYVKYDTDPMYAVFCVEAMTRGMLDRVSLDLGHGGMDYLHDGKGQISDSEVFYNVAKVKVKKVDLGAEQYSLILPEDPAIEIKDIPAHKYEKAIRQMVSLGLMEVDADGNFYPESGVTRGELVQMVVELFGFNDTTVPADFRFTDVAGKPYYEAVVIAENAGILDVNLGATLFEGEKFVNREELASVIVKALQAAMPEKTFYIADSLYRITDADTISSWARDYADIATNYRLMVAIEEDVFQPKVDATRAMVAYAFQNLYRYYGVTGLDKLTASISPYNASNLKVTWETSDCTVVEVDEKGNLYPLKAGSAIITATADGVFSTVEVVVAAKDDWMIKNITFNGAPLEGFNSSTLEYEQNLFLGTTQVPTVTAESYNGAPVEVKLPAALPGRIELKVQGEDVVYTIDVDNTYIKYAVNENFNHKINTKIETVTTDQFNWYIQGTSALQSPFWKVIPKNWVSPSYEGYGCFVFPYLHAYEAGAIARLCIGSDFDYEFGPDADDMLVVVEMEVAVKNLSEKFNGFNLFFSESMSAGSKSVIRLNVNNLNEIKRRTSSTAFNEGTRRVLDEERFYTITLIMDKQTKKTSYYIDGELIEKDIAPFHANVAGFGTIYFEVTKEAEYSNAEMFFDNVKVYELQKHVVEEMYEQVPSPTFSPKPTAEPNPAWVEYPLNETYDSYEVGTLAAATTVDKGYEWGINGKVYPNLTKVVAKTDVDPSAAATDYCLEIPYNAEGGEGTYRLNLDNNLIYKLGAEAVDDKSVVFEMDFAIGGSDKKANGWRVYLSQRSGSGGYLSTSRFHITEDLFGRMTGSSSINTSKAYPMYKNQFAHLKVVVNKQAKTFTYYINGVPVEVGVAAMHAGVPNIGTIYFGSPVEVVDVESSLYIDNLKLYVEETKPEPTAVPAPTPKPTATPNPYPVNEDYNSYAEGTTLTATSTQDYAWAITPVAQASGATVVAKTKVDATAAADDYCVEIPYSATTDINYRLNLSAVNAFPLDTSVIGNKEVVVEMDVAFAGTESKTNGYNLYYSEKHASGTKSTARLRASDEGLKRYVSSAVAASTDVVPGKGTFANLKVAIDPVTKTYKYYWNGALKGTGLSFIHTNTSNFGTLLIAALREDAQKDVAMYLDNLKIYLADPVAGETPAPTAVPVPTATTAPAATATAAPAATATAAPVATATPEVPAATESPVKLDENFNDKTLGASAEDTTGVGYTWTKTTAVTGMAKVIRKNTVDTTAAAEDYCIEIANATAGSYNMVLDASNQVTYDNGGYLVVEMDVATNGTMGADMRIDLNNTATQSIERIKLSGTKIVPHGSAATSETLTPNTFYHSKVVYDITNKTYTWLVNDVVKVSGKKQLHTTHNMFAKITFTIGGSGGTDKAYIDNVKVYTAEENPLATPGPVATATPVPTAEPTAAPTAAPTAEPTATPVATEAPTENPIVIDENWNNATLGESAEDTVGTNYSWTNTAAVADAVKIIQKNTVDATAAAEDYCIEITNATTGSYTMVLDTAKRVTYDNGGYLVVEMDVATNGTMGADMRIELNNASTQSIERIKLSGSKMVLHGPGTSETLTPNTFYHSKVVFDITNKTYTWLVNDVVKISGRNQLHSTHNLFGSIKFTIGGSGGTDKAYIDNVKVYTSQADPMATPEPTVVPTAAPTAAPTQAPTQAPGSSEPSYFYSVNEGYDGLAVGTTVGSTASAGYSWAVTAAYANEIKVVAKTDVVSTAAAGDNCLVFPYLHSLGKAGTFRLNLDSGAEIVIGENAMDTNEVVVSMDVAVAGEGTKTNYFDIFVSKSHVATGQTHSVARWEVRGNEYGPIYADNTLNAWVFHDGANKAVEKNVFNNIKFVIDKATKTFDYYVNDVLVKSDVASAHETVDSVGTIYFGMPMETADTDIKFYVDNIKVYEVAYDE